MAEKNYLMLLSFINMIGKTIMDSMNIDCIAKNAEAFENSTLKNISKINLMMLMILAM